ncbi:M67 family metallopeptidase [Sphingomonas sp. BE138]|uniref:M67 family metallopeptidase n=1 Tax=Sphingomonas sp. BE138 TaxID=2817845 RepID=UPI00286B948B|nr:M67 family metallopeptidase [Sphingomonas sp. BE138]
MMLEITIAQRNDLVAQAAASADEVCGLLLGTGLRVERLAACRNVAATPAVRFEIDPAALIAAHRAARGGGAGVIGHYHSHPSGLARPSPRDAADAAPDGSVWVIVAGTQVTAWRAVDGGAVHGRFDPLPLNLGGCAGPGDSAQDADFTRA